MHILQEQKEGRELMLLVVGNYLTHGPPNVACTQIMGFNSNGRSRQALFANAIFPFIIETKTH